MRLTRVAVVTLALVVCAWFALGARQAREVSEASAIIAGGGHLTAQQVSRAASLLRSARTLNPDLEVDVLRGELALREGHRARAFTILSGVLRSEPTNLLGWVWLSRSASNVAQAELAITNIARLHPAVSAH